MLSSRIKVIIENQARVERNIIYGGQSLNKQIGLKRPTDDFDIYSKDALRSAVKTMNLLNREFLGGFHIEKAKHPGTWKVMFGKTCIADYTQLSLPYPYVREINGILYKVIAEEKAAKIKAIRDPEFRFRYWKDMQDLTQIKRHENKVFSL